MLGAEVRVANALSAVSMSAGVPSALDATQNLGSSGLDAVDHPRFTTTGAAAFNADILETRSAALCCEGLDLLFGPPMTGDAGRVGSHLTLDREHPPSRPQHPVRLR